MHLAQCRASPGCRRCSVRTGHMGSHAEEYRPMIRLTSLSHGLVAESLRAVGCVAAVAVALATCCGEGQRAVAADRGAAADDCDLARKVDIMHGPRW